MVTCLGREEAEDGQGEAARSGRLAGLPRAPHWPTLLWLPGGEAWPSPWPPLSLSLLHRSGWEVARLGDPPPRPLAPGLSLLVSGSGGAYWAQGESGSGAAVPGSSEKYQTFLGG